MIKDTPHLHQSFEDILRKAVQTGLSQTNEILLIRWLIWMLDQKRFKEMRLSTFRGYVSSVSNRVFPLPENKLLVELDQAEWIQMITELALNEDYMPSSRRTAITHMKVLNEFLHGEGLAPKVDFSNYAFRVPRDIAQCEVIFPHEVDSVLSAPISDNQWMAVMLAFYCGLRCEEICYLTPDSLESNYRLIIGRSKLDSSRRIIPHGLLVPDHHLERIHAIALRRRDTGSSYLLETDGQHPIPTWKLSKQVGRLLVRTGSRIRKMYALRHGFASWQLVRYFMIVDAQFRTDVRVGRFNLDLDGRHNWFNDSMLADLAEVIGGIQWRISYEGEGRCLGRATDMLMISKLLGHANRFTTLENYTNTLGWVVRYYLRRREAELSGD